ncbi:hypothetical protein [Rhizobacter sp. Root404]|uniref:hypothetical protein n=1 Tax=Rhizobacter sp. Root404 TaxID=1736528 RepID=UPI000AB9DAD2|nr:hypothetical protein [Rhizobacter sp. Root404]
MNRALCGMNCNLPRRTRGLQTAGRAQFAARQELSVGELAQATRTTEATSRELMEDLPILTIVLECGYGSIGPFNRAFKQRMGGCADGLPHHRTRKQDGVAALIDEHLQIDFRWVIGWPIRWAIR